MKVQFKKNITVNGIQYLQGIAYNITQTIFEYVSTHVLVIEVDKKPEVTETVKNKIINPKNVNKK